MSNFLNRINEKWMSYAELKSIFNYGPTQMASLLKKLIVSKIGKRKFILRDSVDKLLDNNIQ